MLGAGVDEVNEAGAAVELGEEEGGVGLGLGGGDPLEAGADAAVVAAAFTKDPIAFAAYSHGENRRF